MISLKRYLERESEISAEVAFDTYCSTLAAVGDNGRRGCPVSGEVLQRELAAVAGSLAGKRTRSALRSAHKQAVRHLQQWGENTEAYFKKKTAEVKEILIELASTAEFLGKRNQRYATQFDKVMSTLQAIAALEDVSRIRASLLDSAAQLKSCVEQMAREGNESIAQLQASLSTYQIRLEQAEELASRDPLTGLFNRREVESRIERRIATQSQFCIVIVDLDEFKLVNDRHGHIAGDELLRLIAAELKSAARADDIIGRWGGDEFIIVLDCPLMSAQMQVRRLRAWAFGMYEIALGTEHIRVPASASIGMAEWRHDETMLQVMNRADAEMYREKASRGSSVLAPASVLARS